MFEMMLEQELCVASTRAIQAQRFDHPLFSEHLGCDIEGEVSVASIVAMAGACKRKQTNV